ncbi:T9SS type A sorting domain-containing protein [Pontibacter sp. HSC-36F09]|uniref:T9SS type A sorting domain-containing protein n=1 Tax=Pontibacter sp. HSC-36F09 TaxID=2910966 RepID=UPI00209DE58D|nr:T9SS type A sorting domain-containing protein [Pontibacter sp. HSC-36F09]MCP2043828.1 hypothetical protein [Pontibacter sp. HSC-36F09]
MIKLLTLCLLIIGAYPSFAQFNSITFLSQIPISANTGEKPQSKVWAYAGTFWTVLPDNTGTHVWKLVGTQWVSVLKISDKTTSKVDCKVVGEVTHVLLFHESNDENLPAYFDIVTLSYIAEDENYSDHKAASNLSLGNGVETATFDIDGKGRMWLAYARANKVRVRYSDSPYSSWSDEKELTSGLKSDDICAVVALPGRVGIFWSNQNSKKFGFMTHEDGVDTNTWSVVENVDHKTNGSREGGLADDHLNMAVANDGTLYCAIKTSYKHSDQPILGLFVRRPSGIWDNLYSVTKQGTRTRPIVILNEVEKIIRVIYTEREGGGNIVYKESSLDNIDFGDESSNDPDEQKSNREFVLIEGFYNNVTSTKDNFTDDIVIMASSAGNSPSRPVAVSVLATSRIIPLPVELTSFTARLAADDAVLEWKTASEQDNDYFSVESSIDGRTFTPIGRVNGNGTTQLQRSYSFTDKNISRYRAAGIYYRLRQVDYNGEFEFSQIRHVSAPGLPDAITLKAFPSPFDDYLEVLITSSEEQASSIVLYNAQGRIMQSQTIALKRGINTISLTELNLAGGIYFLKVTTAEKQNVLKLVSE